MKLNILKIIELTFWTVFGLVGGFFAYYFRNENQYTQYSWIAVVIIFLPTLFYTLKSFGAKKGLLILVGVIVFGQLIEYTGLVAGFPYGSFEYTGNMGYKLFDVIPLTVGISWSPLVLGSYFVGDYFFPKQNQKFKKFILSVIFLVSIDLILDPGAVALGLWVWDYPGIYYEIPFTNYLGWILSGSVGVGIVQFMDSYKSSTSELQIEIIYSTLVNVLFWIMITISFRFVIPALIGIILLAILFYLLYKNKIWMQKKHS